MIKFVKNTLSNSVLVCGGIFLVSAISLMAALIAQYIYNLEPCILCIYQRFPFGIAMILSASGLALLFRAENVKLVALIVALCGLSFFAGAVIAIHHHGVEQHWWASVMEGCAVNFDPSNTADLMSLIESSQPVRCDEIPWIDPVLGLSMAAWNAIMSPLLALGCWLSSLLIIRKANGVL